MKKRFSSNRKNRLIFLDKTVLFLSQKQRIDSGYYLNQTEQKSKKEKEALKAKKVYSNLGAMFVIAVDKNFGSTENSSNSDEDFELHHAK